MQQKLFAETEFQLVRPFRRGLLKWVGNKQRFAHEIASSFPPRYSTYYEPFLGSGAVLATLAPKSAVGSDCYGPLIEIWQALRHDPERLKGWYAERWHLMNKGDKREAYGYVKQSFNESPNGADLVFLCRSCYGGVVRFRKADGYMSTPCGIHQPISPESFAKRVDEWHIRVGKTEFLQEEYSEAMNRSQAGDLIYCDPPYTYTQAILYGAQSFSLEDLMVEIARCKGRGVFVALSIDGTKKSGDYICDLNLPPDLFEQEILVHCGRSMLKRFQMNGKSLEKEVVQDRLLLTYSP